MTIVRTAKGQVTVLPVKTTASPARGVRVTARVLTAVDQGRVNDLLANP